MWLLYFGIFITMIKVFFFSDNEGTSKKKDRNRRSGGCGCC